MISLNPRGLSLVAVPLLYFSGPLWAQEDLFKELELLDKEDALLLQHEEDLSSIDFSDLEDFERLNTVKSDGEGPTKQAPEKGQKIHVFNTGQEEEKLLELSKRLIGKVPEVEWNDLATKADVQQYEVQKGDWLWKIASRLFGSGFYYSKIWSLNPQVTNPHKIEPGMILFFDTGSSDHPPKVQLGQYDRSDQGQEHTTSLFDWDTYGEVAPPKWFQERKSLLDNKVYFQYISDTTYDDLVEASKRDKEREYEKYDPPDYDIEIQEVRKQYDDTGFDRSSKIFLDFKEGFHLNTFVSTNVVQDLGHIVHGRDENIFVKSFDTVYVHLDDPDQVRPGDRFSIYIPKGKVSHPISDREGFRYDIVGQLRVLAQKDHLWECEVFNNSGVIQRGDRITSYTPKIHRIFKTFNPRSIEAAIIGNYTNNPYGISVGDVVYFDRGRADGVEMGNIFSFYSFVDRGTKERITLNPTYKIGEGVVISLTDNFSTVLVTNNSLEMSLGNLAITEAENKMATKRPEAKDFDPVNLDELDVELNLDDLSEDLLKKAESIQLTEEELEELERLERENSFMEDHDRDMKNIEQLEAEILAAEKKLDEKKIDEDKYLDQLNLDQFESTNPTAENPDAFAPIDSLEKDLGLKYMDEDINAKDNPYGLTEYDLEEIDELLNIESL